MQADRSLSREWFQVSNLKWNVEMFNYSSSIFHHGKIRIRPHYNSNTRANCITSASLSINWNKKRKGVPEYKHAKAGQIINNCKMNTDVFGAWMDSFPRKMRNVIAVGGDPFFSGSYGTLGKCPFSEKIAYRSVNRVLIHLSLAGFLVLIAENRYMTTGDRAGLKQVAPRLRVVADSLYGVIKLWMPATRRLGMGRTCFWVHCRFHFLRHRQISVDDW
jgi:hypothetical protein